MTATLEFRTAVVKALNQNIYYKNQEIPTYESWVDDTEGARKAYIKLGYTDVEFYIIVKNQTEDFSDSGGKCMEAVNASIQVQIYSVYPANSGGSEHAELIGRLVESALIRGQGIRNYLPEYFQLTKLRVSKASNINYNDETKHTWTHVLILTATITEIV